MRLSYCPRLSSTKTIALQDVRLGWPKKLPARPFGPRRGHRCLLYTTAYNCVYTQRSFSHFQRCIKRERNILTGTMSGSVHRCSNASGMHLYLENRSLKHRKHCFYSYKPIAAVIVIASAVLQTKKTFRARAPRSARRSRRSVF